MAPPAGSTGNACHTKNTATAPMMKSSPTETSLATNKVSGGSSRERESRMSQALDRSELNKIICKLPIVAPNPSYLSHLSSKDLKALLCGKSNGDTKTNKLTKLELMQHVWRLMQTSVFEHSLEELKHSHSTAQMSQQESLHIDSLSKKAPPSSSSSAYLSEAAKNTDNWEPVDADLSHVLHTLTNPTDPSSNAISAPSKDRHCHNTVVLPYFASDESIVASIPPDYWVPAVDEGISDALEALIGNEDYFAYKVWKQYMDQIGTTNSKQQDKESTSTNHGHGEVEEDLATAEIIDGLAQCFSSLCAKRSSITSEQNNQSIDSINEFCSADSLPSPQDSLDTILEGIVKSKSKAVEEEGVDTSAAIDTVVNGSSIEACISTFKAVKFVSVSQVSLGITLEMKDGTIRVRNNGMDVNMARHVIVGDALVYVQDYCMLTSPSFVDLLRHIKDAERPIILGFVSSSHHC